MEIRNLLKWLRGELILISRRSLQAWRLVPRSYRFALGFAAFLMAFTSAANIVIPLLLGQLIAGLQAASQETSTASGSEAIFRTAVYYLGLIGAVYVVREIIHVIRRYMVENICTRINRDMTIGTFSHVLKADLQNYSHEKVGALHGRICRSVDGLVRFLRLSFLDFIPAILTGIFAIGMTLSNAPILGLVMLGVIPISVGLTVWQLMSQTKVRIQLMRNREEMDGTMIEQLNGIDYVRAANTVELEAFRVSESAEKLRSKEIRHHLHMSLFGCAKAINEGFFHLLVLTVGVHLAIQGEIQFHEIFTYSMLFLNLMAPLSEVHRIIDEGHESSLRVADLLNILHAPVDQSFLAQDPKSLKIDAAEPIIFVRNLSVEYETVDGQIRQALKGVNFTIRYGERIGIAGRSGSGKSTWLKALLRLTHPSAGEIFFGGVPLENVSRESIAKMIGYVGQTPFIFSGTIADNIAYGVEGASREAIQQAAIRSCIHEEILAIPGGYDSLVTERGQNLSGGQKQRIALARLFLKDPPVMILDEATSALDTISERCVQRAIADTRPDRTVIIVAHRLSTLLDTDRILVFDEGKIVENGNFNMLVQQGGIFTDLLASAQTPGSPNSINAP